MKVCAVTAEDGGTRRKQPLWEWRSRCSEHKDGAQRSLLLVELIELAKKQSQGQQDQ